MLQGFLEGLCLGTAAADMGSIVAIPLWLRLGARYPGAMRVLASPGMALFSFFAVVACSSGIDVVGPQGSGGSVATNGVGAGSPTGSGDASSGTTGSGASGSGNAGSTSAGGTTTGSAGSAASGSGTAVSSGAGGGAPPDDACGNCAEDAVDGTCAGAFANCSASFACEQLLECHGDCGWTNECNAQCDAIIPSGVALFSELIACIACVNCLGPCGDSSLGAYCNN